MLYFKHGFVITLIVVVTMITSSKLAAANGNLREMSIIKYINLVDNRKITVNFEKLEFDNGHLIFPLYLCPSDSEYLCMFGGVPFAVPRELTGDKTKWELRGHLFRNVGQRRITLMGKTYSAYKIVYSDEEGEMWYLYSKKRGLFSFGHSSNKSKSSTFLLEGKCGFAASFDCAKITEGKGDS